MTQHPEIITAPFTIWIAPVGTAFPAMGTAPAAPWRLLGTNGARGYGESGVVLASSQQWVSAAPPAGETASTATALESEELRVRLDLIDLTLEQFALTMGGGAVDTIAPGPGTAGFRRMGLAIGPGRAEEFALLVRGPSPYNEDMPAQFELPRACQVGSPQPVFSGASPARLAVEFKLLPDPAATSEAERFGRLVAQDSLPGAPAFSPGPSIGTDGTPQVGETVTLNIGTVFGGTVAGEDIELLRGATVIATDPGATYTLAAGDEGESLSLRATARGVGGETTATSAAIGPVTLPVVDPTFGSLRAPPENGEDPVSLVTQANGENGLLYLAGSSGNANLVSAASPWLASSGCILIMFDIERMVVDPLNRAPYLMGTAIESTSVLRYFAVRYTPLSSGTNATKAGRFSVMGRGESGETTAPFLADSAVVPFTTGRGLLAMRFDNTNFQVDVVNPDGTILAGTPVAKPAGWAGIRNLTNNVSLFAVAEQRWPQLASANTHQTINAFRGSIGFATMGDTRPSDADLQAIVAGADPVAVLGSGNVRLHCRLTPNGAKDLAVVSNRAAFASASLTQRGTIYPGSSLRPQSQASYFTLDRLPDPFICTVLDGQTTGRVPVSFKLAGVSGAIQCQVQDEDGTVFSPAWRDVVTASGATASGVVNLPFHPDDKAYRLLFRIPDGAGGYLYAVHNGDVVVALSGVALGQSETNRVIDFQVTATGNSGASLDATGLASWLSIGGKHVYRTGWFTASSVDYPAIYRSRFAPYLAGVGQIAMVKHIREKASEPLAFVAAAEPGTSAFAFMNDADTSRRWSRFDVALSAIGSRDTSLRPMVNTILKMWEQFFGGATLSEQVIRPLATGVESLTQSGSFIAQADIDHSLNDGVSLAPGYRFGVIPANRSAGGGSSTTDVSVPADKRANVRANAVTFGANFVGAEMGVHSVEPTGVDATTHQDTARLTGVWPASRKYGDSFLIGWRKLDYTRPTIASAVLTSPNVITVTVTGKAGDTLDTEGNFYADEYGDTAVSPIGLTVTGFEVADGGGASSRNGFTAAIATGTTITLTKTSGNWTASGLAILFNSGGPLGYTGLNGTGNTAAEDAAIKANPVFGGHEIAGSNTPISVT